MSGPEQRVGGPVADDRARVIAEAKAEALREAAQVWQWGQWANAPRRKDRVEERIANAQHVTDWLRARAAALAPAVAAALPTPAPEAPAGEDVRLTADERDSLYRLAEDLIRHRGRDADDGRLILRLLDPTQRGAADQATLAAVRAVLERMSARNVDHRHPEEVGAWGVQGRAYYYAGDIVDDITDLLAALDGPDAGGGRRG